MGFCSCGMHGSPAGRINGRLCDRGGAGDQLGVVVFWTSVSSKGKESKWSCVLSVCMRVQRGEAMDVYADRGGAGGQFILEVCWTNVSPK